MPFVLPLHSDTEGFLLKFGCKTSTRPPGFSGGVAESFSAIFVLSEEQVVALSVPVLTHLLVAGGTKCLHSACIHVITNEGGCVCRCALDLSFVNRTNPRPCWDFCREWWGSGMVGERRGGAWLRTSCWQAVLDCIVRIDLFVVLDYFSVSRLDCWIFNYSMT